MDAIMSRSHDWHPRVVWLYQGALGEVKGQKSRVALEGSLHSRWSCLGISMLVTQEEQTLSTLKPGLGVLFPAGGWRQMCTQRIRITSGDDDNGCGTGQREGRSKGGHG